MFLGNTHEGTWKQSRKGKKITGFLNKLLLKLLWNSGTSWKEGFCIFIAPLSPSAAGGVVGVGGGGVGGWVSGGNVGRWVGGVGGGGLWGGIVGWGGGGGGLLPGLFRAMVLNCPNVMTLQYSSSCCCDP